MRIPFLCRLLGLGLILAMGTVVGAHAQDVLGSSLPKRVRASLAGAIEVTQGLQDPQNRVPLVGGRPTWARVYVRAEAAGPLQVRGRLRVWTKRGEDTVLVSEGAALLKAGADGVAATERQVAERSLNFHLPTALTVPGAAKLQVVALFDAATGRTIACEDCGGATTSVTFRDSAVLRVKAIGLDFGDGVLPRPTDFEHLRSWLQRTYPVARVELEPWYLRARVPRNCHDVNLHLARIRALDIKGGADPRTRYYGLMYDGGYDEGAVQGCAAGVPDVADPTIVASGPAGAPRSYPWDADGSYADWYGGHEIAHTLGRGHFPECVPVSRAGEANLVLDARKGRFDLLRGDSLFDVMAYGCGLRWLGVETYRGVLERLEKEAGQYRRMLFGRRGAPGPASAGSSVGADPFINVIGAFWDLDADSGAIYGLVTVPFRGRAEEVDRAVLDTVAADRRVDLELWDESRTRLLGTHTAWVQLDQAEPAAGNARTGMVNAYIPNRPDLAYLRMYRAGRFVDEERVSRTPPRLRGEPAGWMGSDTFHFKWEVRDDWEDTITYYLQISFDGEKRWSTFDVRHVGEVALPLGYARDREQVAIRVVASDGKNDVVLFRSCNLVEVARAAARGSRGHPLVCWGADDR